MIPTSDALVGTSLPIRAVRDEMLYAARSDAKVLITGESGVGKEVVARLIHTDSSRRTQPFVTVNCAGVPETLLESELFGHERGSFTGAYRNRAGFLEQADGGTIFMDEVGEMTARMQVVLLRFLETGEIQRVGSDRPHTRVNARVIAATNRNLANRIGTGDFREDLYYRLNVVHIWIPPLRERRDDIPALLRYFLGVYARQYAVDAPLVSPEAEASLVQYEWPGNVRELRNFVERLTVRKANALVNAADVALLLGRQRETTEPAAPAPDSAPAASPAGVNAADGLFRRMVDEEECFWHVVHEPFMSRDLTREDVRAIIRKGLSFTHGNYKQLLRLFNMSEQDYKRFLNFLHKYGCTVPVQRHAIVASTPRPMAPVA
jgi:two-component system nitrogen regulation response regulator NtrX